jgi:hypothetical protein
MAEMSETQFTRTGGVDIAYQVVGSPGQLDLLFIPGWVSHLEMMWELPEFARFLDRLAAMGRLILFDKRGHRAFGPGGGDAGAGAAGRRHRGGDERRRIGQGCDRRVG